jgi:hypothetical protein
MASDQRSPPQAEDRQKRAAWPVATGASPRRVGADGERGNWNQKGDDQSRGLEGDSLECSNRIKFLAGGLLFCIVIFLESVLEGLRFELRSSAVTAATVTLMWTSDLDPTCHQL